MFSIDFPEIVIILGVALVVLGPKKLPGAAAKIGRWVGRARTMARQFREQLEQEVASAENAIDIRDSFESDTSPGRKPPAPGAPAAERSAEAPPEASPGATVPHGDAAHPTSAPEPPDGLAPHEPALYESGPYEMPPPEGYGPAPQQLTFDAQLHDTACPPEAATAGSSAGIDSHPGDPGDWMPETQTWMSSVGWETAEQAHGETEGARPERDKAAPAPQAPAPVGQDDH